MAHGRSERRAVSPARGPTRRPWCVRRCAICSARCPRPPSRAPTTPTTRSPRSPDLVNRRFTAERPNQLWLADLTYIRTWSGWVYVAFVLDAYSRRIVGWQAATHLPHGPAAGRAGDSAVAAEDQEGRRAHPPQRQRVAVRVHSLYGTSRGGRGFRVGGFRRGQL
ncbi:hypothetical protein CUT44_19100 [Streptomyces carminius]|uniref:Integrase catalytic domain-containing protein n=1 Tax=Streptomyces carminius TaxID=2665496 RepID=A0A2M8LVE4_9ACTN|nr:hypothetical protein CUT44_19100 [Streptomyces carminius]